MPGSQTANHSVSAKRVKSDIFAGEAFAGTIVVLIVAPFVAAADILHTYAPFLLLRLWLTCFAAYGIVLARAAGGFRRMWMLPYGLMGALFLFVWGLEVEQWGVIDLACAAMIAVSTLFLRSEPQRPSAQGAV